MLEQKTEWCNSESWEEYKIHLRWTAFWRWGNMPRGLGRTAWSRWPKSRHPISRCSTLTPILYYRNCGLLRHHWLAQVSPWPPCKCILHRNWGQKETAFSSMVDTVAQCSLKQVFHLMRCWRESGGNRNMQGVWRQNGKVSYQQDCVNIFLRAVRQHVPGLQSGITVVLPLN